MRDHLDTQIRELTYKLVHMAPEAPPFPEVSVITVTPQKRAPSPRPPRRPAAAWAAAVAFVAVLLVGVAMLVLRPEPQPVTPATTLTTLTTVPDAPPTSVPVVAVPFDVSLYYLADYVEASNVPGPHLVAVRRTVSASVPPGTLDVGDRLRSAILALLAGPAADDGRLIPGITSEVPGGTELVGVTVERGEAATRVTLEFNDAFAMGGGTFSVLSRLSQVVYTATQFDEIGEVELVIDGEPVDVFSSEGVVLGGPLSRDEFTDVLPLIFVDSPLPGALVSSPLEIVGASNTFEGTVEFLLELEDGTVLADGFTTATCGNGCWGDFAITAEYSLAEATAGSIVVKESSAEDGRPINVVRVPVAFEAASGDGVTLALDAGLDFSLGSGYFPGIAVAESPLPVIGSTIAGASVTVDGAAVAVDDSGTFSALVELTPGQNTVPVRATLADRAGETELVVTYLPGGETNLAFVTRVDSSSVTADYAQWLTGHEASVAAFEDGVIGSVEEGVPNDYYIRNDNPMLRELVTLPDPVVVLISPVDVSPVAVEVSEWRALFKPDGSPWNYDTDAVPDWDAPFFGYYGAGLTGTPYWLTVDADGAVVQILQQYVP